MNGDNKVLKIVFVILLLAVLGEVVYFFSIPKSQPESENNIAPVPEPTFGLSGPDSKEFPPAFSMNTLDNYSRIPSYPNTKVNVYFESRNKVVEISTEPVTVGTQVNPYGIKFDYGSGIEKWVHFSKNDISKMKILMDESGGGLKKPANFTDIKKGDIVLLKSTTNPFYDVDDPRQLVEIELDIIR